MPRYYSFKVTLQDVKPRIWRAFLLRGTATFFDLHDAIQIACGWEDDHLFHFVHKQLGEAIAGVPDEQGLDSPDPDAKRVKLASHFGTEIGTRCFYEYDFGDAWLHEIVLTEIVEREGNAKRVLLGGEMAFPPEDCGGAPGYERCVAAVTGKGWTKDMGGKAEREEMARWLGAWTPAAFDLVATKRAFDR